MMAARKVTVCFVKKTAESGEKRESMILEKIPVSGPTAGCSTVVIPEKTGADFFGSTGDKEVPFERFGAVEETEQYFYGVFSSCTGEKAEEIIRRHMLVDARKRHRQLYLQAQKVYAEIIRCRKEIAAMEQTKNNREKK